MMMLVIFTLKNDNQFSTQVNANMGVWLLGLKAIECGKRVIKLKLI